MAHTWHFFRAGGVDQVSLRNGQDILSLADLDQKLWVALAMPVQGVDIDPDTLALIDLDGDGRIRVNDILATVAWAKTAFTNADDVLKSSSEVKLTAIADAKVLAAARRMLTDLGKPDATSISVEDAQAITKAFADTVLNGDGIVIPGSTKEDDLARVITDAIATVGGVDDRSGKPGIDQARADEMFAAVDLRAAWLARGADAALLPLGAATAAAATALLAVADKLEDFFTRCRVTAFDPRAAAALGGTDADLAALATRTLSAGDDELARLPLAHIAAAGRLPLTAGLNPAWTARIAAFVADALTPIVGPRDVLLPADLAAVRAKLADHLAWRAAEPRTKVDGLDPAWIATLAQPGLRGQLTALIAEDAALAGEFDQLTSVAKLVRLQRDGGRLLRNFVNFSDFYARQDGVFQAGTLYIDARAIQLCVPVADPAKHAALAASSDAFLIYCDITRKGVTKQIAAALTNGDGDNIFVGRNGVFYDRQGDDWDATVTTIISSPINVRQAFWSPYKKLVKTIDAAVTKRAVAADAAATGKLETVGQGVASADKAASGAAPPPSIGSKKIDLGTVAAIGVAIGGIGTLFGAVLAAMLGLGPWLPLGLLAALLLISGPSMALAYLKLRRRNIGPILDANGWAINGRARINVSFGAALTGLPRLPKGAQRSLDDPFADKRTPWRLYTLIAAIVILAGAWYVGKLDRFLPVAVRSTEVLGANAPAAKTAAEAAAAVGCTGSGRARELDRDDSSPAA